MKLKRHEPDYARWLRKDTWTLPEAVCLVLGLDPKYEHMVASISRKLKEDYDDLLDTAHRAEGKSLKIISPTGASYIATFDANVEPKAFVQWTHSIGCVIPDPFTHLLEIRDDVMPKQPQQLAVDLGGKPRLLKAAVDAYQRVWIDNEVNSAQKQAIPWLQKTYKISVQEAKAIDKIIRPDERKKGALLKS